MTIPGAIGGGNREDEMAGLLPKRRKLDEHVVPRAPGSLEKDMFPRVCQTCGREMLAWQKVCPDDAGVTLTRQEMQQRKEARQAGSSSAAGLGALSGASSYVVRSTATTPKSAPAVDQD